MYQEHSMAGINLCKTTLKVKVSVLSSVRETPVAVRSTALVTYGRSKHRRSPGTCQHLKVNMASHTCLGLRAIFVCPPAGSTEDHFVEGRECSWSQFNHRPCQCNWWPRRHGGVAAVAACDLGRAVSPELAS